MMNIIMDQERITKSYVKDFDAALATGNRAEARKILRDWLHESERLDVMEDIYKAIRA